MLPKLKNMKTIIKSRLSATLANRRNQLKNAPFWKISAKVNNVYHNYNSMEVTLSHIRNTHTHNTNTHTHNTNNTHNTTHTQHTQHTHTHTHTYLPVSLSQDIYL